MDAEREVVINELFDELQGDIEEVRDELLYPSGQPNDPEWLELIRDVTDKAHLMLHEVISALWLSTTPGAELIPQRSRVSLPPGARMSPCRFEEAPDDE